MNTWYILGAGAIGGLWATRLHRAGFPVQLLHAHSKACLRTLSVEENNRRVQTAFHVLHTPPQEPVVRRLLICTKAQQTADALHPWRQALHANACIILMQNGLGVREELLAEMPSLRVLNATTTDGVFRRSRDELVVAGQGETRLGSLDESLLPLSRALAQELIQANLPIRFDSAIKTALWRKLVINCAINPVTVLFSCHNGDLLTKPAALQLMREVCRELVPLLAAESIDLPADDLFHLVKAVAHITAANTSSMLADAHAGTTTEINYMNGYVVRRLRSLGLPHATNQALYEAIADRHR